MMARRVAALTVWGLSWSLAGAAVALRWFAGTDGQPIPGVFLSQAPAEIRASFGTIGVTVAFVYGPVSAIILARRPHPVGLILAVHAVGSGIAALGVQWGALGAVHPGLPAWGLLAFAAGWGYVPGTFMTAVLPLLVTREQLPVFQRVLVAVCGVGAALAFVVSVIQQSVPSPRNPLALRIAAVQEVLPLLYTVLTIAVLALSAVSCLILFQRWHQATGRTRSGLAWLTLGHLFLSLSYLALVLPAGLAPPRWAIEFGLVAPAVGQVLYPSAILVVVLGQRLWGIEVVVSRLVLWSLLTISAVALYLAVIIAPQRLLPGSPALWFLTPLLIAVAVQPLRQWLQRHIDQLIYGEGTDPAALLARLGDRIGELEPGEPGLQQLAEALRRVLRLGAVEILSGTTSMGAATGHAAGEQIVIAVRSGAERVGDLVVRPPDGQRLDRRTVSVLEDVAGLVATAIRLAESHRLLEQARVDLVALRAAERRSVRRELHDGLGPALAGIGFGLAAVENLVSSDPEKAGRLLGELSDELGRKVRDVSSLAEDVVPSPLADSTLAEALGELALRFDSPTRRVHIRIDPVPMAAATQQALYLIAAEAMTNAVRHAGANLIEVRVRAEGDRIELVVHDDGDGMDGSATPGVGLGSMAERARDLGGDVRFDSGDGTTVIVSVPARDSTAAVRTGER